MPSSSFLCVFVLLFLGNVFASPARVVAPSKHTHKHEHLSVPVVAIKSKPVASVLKNIDGLTVSVRTSAVTSVKEEPKLSLLAAAAATTRVKGTVLVLARDLASSYSATSGLNGYGIRYEVLLVPQAGVTLPALNSSSTSGNYGAIVVVSEVSYDYSGNFHSAITAAQWTQIYQYQVAFGVRLVRLDTFPSTDIGVTSLGGCCNTGVQQLVQFSNTAAFPTAGLKTGAGVSTDGLWHYPARIVNPAIATAFLTFGPATGFPASSVAGVINKISGRQQMVFFIGFSTDWSSTSTYLQHSWIHWSTRGLYTGYRRANLNTQVDDMFLESDIYYPAGTTYKITTADLDQHITWMASVNSRLSPGSNYFIEIAHNGNGNIEAAVVTDEFICDAGPIEYDEINYGTPLEFVKPAGTGTSLWPDWTDGYTYTDTCTSQDALLRWWQQPNNLNAFAHVSHTFTHEDQNNATYFDVFREIGWNRDWLNGVGIGAATKFSLNGLVPPSISGLHNTDALRAWAENGVTQVVGDNTRPALLNQQNEFWPLITTVAANGYDGVQITPRWSTNIYYNCHIPDCTVNEWIATSAGSGDWYALLALEKESNTRHLFGLRRDPYMFHQANLNYVTAPTTTINGVTSQLSLLQAWVETVTQEFVRLTNWPLITLKHNDFSAEFAKRLTRDQCIPDITYTVDTTAKTVTGVTITATGNTCAAEIPVTVPGPVVDTQGFRTEQIGNDPLTIWVQLTGASVLTTFNLVTPIPI